MKTAEGLFDVGVQARKRYNTWDTIKDRDEAFEKHRLHEHDINIVRQGFDGKYPGQYVPSRSDIFPFGKPNKAGKSYAQVKPEYYLWFLEQDWKEKWPQVVAYCDYYMEWILKDKKDIEIMQDRVSESELAAFFSEVT